MGMSFLSLLIAASYVCYQTPEEANKAIQSLHGYMLKSHELYVTLHQSKVLCCFWVLSSLRKSVRRIAAWPTLWLPFLPTTTTTPTCLVSLTWCPIWMVLILIWCLIYLLRWTIIWSDAMQRTTTIAITIAMRIRWCILPTRTTWLPVCVCLWLSYVGMMNPNEMVNPRMPQAAAQGYPYASTFAPAPMSPFEQSVWLSTSLWLLCRSRTFLFLRRKIWWRWMRLSARTSSELISTPASTLLLLSRSLRLRAWCLNCLLRSFILTFLFQRCLKRESRMPSMYFVLSRCFRV